MRKIVLILVFTLLAISNDGFPKRVVTSIQSIGKNGIVTLSGDIPKGRSGIVVHNYGKGLSAITHTLITLPNNRASIAKYDMSIDSNMPTVDTPIRVGDRVILGNLYSNVLLIAPDEQSYSKITKTFNKVWIHPDIYAFYLIKNGEDRVTIKNLKKFAIENDVGLVAIVARDGLRIFDPLSGHYLRKLPIDIDITKAQSPFYARFEQIDTNIFSVASKKEFPKYYKGVDNIR